MQVGPLVYKGRKKFTKYSVVRDRQLRAAECRMEKTDKEGEGSLQNSHSFQSHQASFQALQVRENHKCIFQPFLVVYSESPREA